VVNLASAQHWPVYSSTSWLPAAGWIHQCLRLQLTLGNLFLMFRAAKCCLPSRLAASVAAGWMVGRREQLDSAQLETLIRQLAQLAVAFLFSLLAPMSPGRELSRSVSVGGLVLA